MGNSSRPFLWQVTDPRGLQVTLSSDSWAHVLDAHREMVDFLAQVRTTVQDPDAIYYDPKSTSHLQSGARVYWYMKAQLLSGRLEDDWVAVIVKVVVEETLLRGYVSTALPVDKPMSRLILEWTKN